MSDHNPLAALAHGHSLAEAIVDTVREPLVVLDRDLRVIAASRSFYRTFAAAPRNTQGRKLYELGDGQWNIPALRKREGAVDQGSGPLDQRSTKQLKSDLAKSELTPRKKSFVQEILRRRREAKAGGRSRKYVWLGTIITAFSLIGAALTRWGSREIGKK